MITVLASQPRNGVEYCHMSLESVAESYLENIWNGAPYSEFEKGGECNVGMPLVKEDVDNFGRESPEEFYDRVYSSLKFRSDFENQQSRLNVVERITKYRARKMSALKFMTGETRTLVTAEDAEEELDVLLSRALSLAHHQGDFGTGSTFVVGIMEEARLVANWITEHSYVSKVDSIALQKPKRRGLESLREVARELRIGGGIEEEGKERVTGIAVDPDEALANRFIKPADAYDRLNRIAIEDEVERRLLDEETITEEAEDRLGAGGTHPIRSPHAGQKER